ncbi:protein FAR1-RELATED SEQUENCE 2-like [Chenopodium quinoa]|uniref:protein FAR1-RELATED SEQUENCE 2-like n=1 Tax=Chenopodium quinoa TaxID=63459 RepID=UPI000B776863|nr:protein FAR1-RELATED SEQUENCE 2-like [Chenopodium quinoa]
MTIALGLMILLWGEGSVEFGNDDMIDEEEEDGDDDGEDVEEIWCEEEGEGEENGEFSYEEEVEDGMEMEYEDGGVSGGGENVGGSSVVTPKRKVLVDTFVGEEEELEPPAISMVFGSWDVVDSYFWRYARQKGFGIVRAASSWAKVKSELGDGSERLILLRKDWRKIMIVEKRKTKKCSCPVELYASVNAAGDWVIHKVYLEHKRHIVTPRKARDVSMFHKHELLAKNKHLVKQACNAKKSRFGKDGALQDVLWVDARSRAAYEEFGDIVCFDSTYLTNIFHLPFAVFLEVNHHGQSILFGCALISRETVETYVWVFKTWLNCMGDKAPTSILTDQDPAIRKVVHLVLNQTCHRWCIWHILQKFGKYLGKLGKYEELSDELKNIIYGSLVP